ncbi:non-homologous end-joining DNA ligase [Salinifilum aidingensis]
MAGTEVSHHVTVDVDGVRLTLSNPDKPLYPAAGFRKRDVLSYYHRAAEAVLPHVRDRAATLVRAPDGVGGASFLERNTGSRAPEWVDAVPVTSDADGSGSATNHHVRINDLPTLIWTADLAALELHVPQWTVERDGRRHLPDLLVFDLDPGDPATVVDCCRIAERLHRVLHADGLRAFPKTSGSAGMQLYCPISVAEAARPADYARELAQRLAREHPEHVVATAGRELRRGKVFIDWSRNNAATATVAAYSLRARSRPTVSTPVTWAEVHRCSEPHQLVFTAEQVLRRLDSGLDPFEGLHEAPTAL